MKREPVHIAIGSEITFDHDVSAAEPDLSTVGGLMEELERQAALLAAVAVVGGRTETRQAEYQRHRQRLVRAVERRRLVRVQGCTS